MRPRSLLSFALAAVMLFACSSSSGDDATSGKRPDGKACGSGDTRECKGPGACSGAQVCNADGSGYEACDCGTGSQAGRGGTGGTDGGSGAGGTSATGGTSSSAGTGGTTASGGTGGSGAGAGGSGTPGSACDVGAPQTGCEACSSCSQGSVCKTEWKALEADPGFSDYAFCLAACGSDSDCLKECGTASPEAAAKFETYANCAFCKACPNTCQASNLDDCK